MFHSEAKPLVTNIDTNAAKKIYAFKLSVPIFSMML